MAVAAGSARTADPHPSSSDTATIISIQIPETAEPGDTLTFEPTPGQLLEIVVPMGSLSGDVLQVQVGSSRREQAAAAAAEEEEEDAPENSVITKFDLDEGIMLELHSELPSDHADAPTNRATSDHNQKSKGVPYNITNSDDDDDDDDDREHDGTFALPWSSGVELAKRWETLINWEALQLTPRKRILELGSGLGLVGMSFAVKQAQHIAKKAPIVLTDLPSALPLLQFNVERNQPLLGTDTVETRPLRWTLERPDHDLNITPISEPPYYDCILGSDLLYNYDYIPHLVATIQRLLHPTQGMIVLAVRWRKPDLERFFFQELEKTVDWTLLIPSDHPVLYPTLSWENFGNPNYEKSNHYFHQTQISVQGRPKALADITEEEAEKLLGDEFEAWERAHIQFYLGRPKISARKTNAT